MKRLLFFAGLIVAIASIGGNTLAAHAQTTGTADNSQTLTPAQVAALEQELDVAKATLANLEMQAGVVPPADAGTPSVIPASIAGTGSQGGSVAVTPATAAGLSVAQASQFSATLSTLAATLGQLNTSLAANTTLTPSQQTAVQTTLNGMDNTLVAMANTIATDETAPANSAPVATTQPSAGAPVAVNTAPSTPAAPAATTPAPAPVAVTAPSTPVATAQPAAAANNVAPQTAQASSLWSFTKAHWPTIVIVLLVIAILAILFWPEKKEPVRTVSMGNSGSGKPKSAPTPSLTTATTVNFSQGNDSNPPAATPVANAVAAPSQK